MDAFEENLKIVYNSFNLTTLDDKTKQILNQFMEAYNQTLYQHLNLDYELSEVTERLKKLTGPVQKALNTPNDGKLHPAAEFIKNKLEEQGRDMEKPFTKTLKNPNVPSILSSDEPMNGFSLAVIIICFTIVLGMVFGALLFVIN